MCDINRQLDPGRRLKEVQSIYPVLISANITIVMFVTTIFSTHKSWDPSVELSIRRQSLHMCVFFVLITNVIKIVELFACPAGVHIDEPSPPVTPVFHQTQIPDDMRRKLGGLSPGTGMISQGMIRQV